MYVFMLYLFWSGRPVEIQLKPATLVHPTALCVDAMLRLLFCWTQPTLMAGRQARRNPSSGSCVSGRSSCPSQVRGKVTNSGEVAVWRRVGVEISPIKRKQFSIGLYALGEMFVMYCSWNQVFYSHEVSPNNGWWVVSLCFLT